MNKNFLKYTRLLKKIPAVAVITTASRLQLQLSEKKMRLYAVAVIRSIYTCVCTSQWWHTYPVTYHWLDDRHLFYSDIFEYCISGAVLHTCAIWPVMGHFSSDPALAGSSAFALQLSPIIPSCDLLYFLAIFYSEIYIFKLQHIHQVSF